MADDYSVFLTENIPPPAQYFIPPRAGVKIVVANGSPFAAATVLVQFWILRSGKRPTTHTETITVQASTAAPLNIFNQTLPIADGFLLSCVAVNNGPALSQDVQLTVQILYSVDPTSQVMFQLFDSNFPVNGVLIAPANALTNILSSPVTLPIADPGGNTLSFSMPSAFNAYIDWFTVTLQTSGIAGTRTLRLTIFLGANVLYQLFSSTGIPASVSAQYNYMANNVPENSFIAGALTIVQVPIQRMFLPAGYTFEIATLNPKAGDVLSGIKLTTQQATGL